MQAPMHCAPDINRHKQLFWAIPPAPYVHTCTQTHSQFACVCFPLPLCTCPASNPHSQLASGPPQLDNLSFLDLGFFP